MNIKDLLPKNLPFLNRTQENNEYYFALNIGSDSLGASVWGIVGNKLQIVNSVHRKIRHDEDLVEAANVLLDDCLMDFQPEPEKILFGVPDSWLLDDNLKETHLNFLKNLVKELDVEPMAYVSTTHAISHMIQKQTGVPSTVILVNIADPLIVTVVKGGKVVGSHTAKRSEDLPRDIERALHSFAEIEVLPSKITLYGEGDLDKYEQSSTSANQRLEKYKDALLSFNWMGTLPFLHLPKIDVLEEGVAVKAISLAGAAEINPDVTFSSAAAFPPPRRGVLPGSDLTDEERPAGRRAAPGGFVAGDVAAIEDEPVEQNVSLPVRQQTGMRAPGSGAVVGVENAINRAKGKWAGVLGFLQTKGFNLKLPNGTRARLSAKVILPAAAIILLFLGYIFLAKATVTIYVDPKILEKDAQVVADPSATTVDQQNKVIPGKIVETDIEGNAKGTATGTKQIGDPAKGSVDIYNKSDSPKTYSQGTTLNGPNNLAFTLDSSVTIASASSDLSGTTYGKATVNVTAKQIGPDSNLPSGTTTLSISGDSSSNVVVNQALSGGTSKNVQVVTPDDQKKALAALASDLRNQAQTKLQSKLSGDEKILPEALDEKITNTSYSKKVGDEATDFTIDMTIHYKGTAYSDNDLKTMVGSLVETNVPDGFELNLSQTTTQADVSKLESDGKLIFLAKFKASLFPKLDEEAIKNQIKGKSPASALQIIQGTDNVIGSDISLAPSLPGPLKVMPFLSRNINVVVTTK